MITTLKTTVANLFEYIGLASTTVFETDDIKDSITQQAFWEMLIRREREKTQGKQDNFTKGEIKLIIARLKLLAQTIHSLWEDYQNKMREIMEMCENETEGNYLIACDNIKNIHTLFELLKKSSKFSIKVNDNDNVILEFYLSSE